MSWKLLAYIGSCLAGVLLLLLLWGVLIEPRLFQLKRETAVLPGLPQKWEGKRIALIADTQVGMWFGNEETVARIVDRLIAERPAAVLFAGDLVYHPADEDEPDEAEREEMRNFMTEINRAVALLRPLTEADFAKGRGSSRERKRNRRFTEGNEGHKVRTFRCLCLLL